MKLNLNTDGTYVLKLELTVIPKEGSGTVLTVEDVSNALKNHGCKVSPISLLSKDTDTARLLVVPPRHIVTGQDIELESEERNEQKS